MEDRIKGRIAEFGFRLPCAILMGLVALGAVAEAQESQDSGVTGSDVIEEVVVTGIRASLMQARDAKRNADGIVDVVTADDIGKLPDENVADALSRLPGVAIRRLRGEGDFVSVRGMPPHMVPVTINGRPMVSGRGGEQSSLDSLFNTPGREIAFNVLPSELVGGLEVHKSVSAEQLEGGIGGYVNVVTRRPLDRQGFHAAASFQGISDNKADGVDPKASALVSMTSDDGTMGALISASYSTRNLREDSYFNYGWAKFGVDDLATPDVVDHAEARFPWEGIVAHEEAELERIGVAGTVQWLPREDFEFSVDGLFTQLKSTGVFSQLNAPQFNGSPLAAYGVQVDGGRLAAASSMGPDGEVVEFGILPSQDVTYDEFDTASVGSHIRWNATSGVTVDADIAYTSAVSDGVTDQARFRRTIPMEFSFPDAGQYFGSVSSSVDINSGLDQYIPININGWQRDASASDFTTRLDVNWAMAGGMIESIDVGARYSINRKESIFAACTSCGPNIGELKARGFSMADIPVTRIAPSDFLGYSSSRVFREFTVPDVASGRVLEIAGVAEAPVSPRGWFEGRTYEVRETVSAAYARVNFAFEDLGAPVTGNVGVRAVSTDQESTGYSATRIRLRVPADGGLASVLEHDGVKRTAGKTYTELLPSLNLRVDLSDSMVGRLAVGRALGRSELQYIIPQFSYSTSNPPTGRGGNPDLEPFVSTNYDLSLEWYFAPASLVFGAVFRKDIEGYVFQDTFANQTVAGQQFFTVSMPRNAGSAEITGFEVAYQQTFEFLPVPMNGLGVLLNYTKLDSSTSIDQLPGSLLPDTFRLVGLPDNMFNAMVFYENDRLSARLAYNWRDSFLHLEQLHFASRSRAAVGQLDGSVSFRVFDNWTLYLEAVGLNDPLEETYDAGDPGLPSQSRQVGARYFFGIRGSF